MTNVESMMLAICFGCCMGFMIGNIGFLVIEAVQQFKEKRHKKKEVNKE